MYFILYEVCNKIGDAGCDYLALSQLNRLSSLCLRTFPLTPDDNNIGDAGAKFLTQLQGDNLKELSLCNSASIQPKTEYPTKAADTWPKTNGRTLKPSA